MFTVAVDITVALRYSTKVSGGFKNASSLSLSSILVWKKPLYFLNIAFALKECYLYRWNFCV